jgi:serine phosphatase RsbU (regulator of sigma subunit)
VITDISQYLKSGELEKDRPGSDQVKELLETLQKAGQSLSPATLPDWSQFEMGIAKYKGSGPFSLYYDFFKLPSNAYLILLAEANSTGIEGFVYMGILRGMVRMFMQEKNLNSKEAFRPLQLTEALNRLIAEDSLEQSFGLSLVILNPLRDELYFISCGLGGLLHLSQGALKPRILSSQNPALGTDAQGEFAVTTDNWNQGDTLFLHSLETGGPSDTELETRLLEAISETLLLSPQRQAEAILKRVSLTPAFSLQRHPKALLSIQRIS